MHLSPAQSRRALTLASLLFLPPTLIIGIWLAQYGGFAFEPPLMHAVHAHVGTWFDPIATVLHYLGKTAIAVPLIGAVAAALYFADKKREALFCVLAALVPTLNMLIVKVWFARERPLLWPRLIEESNFSFPSGHSTFSAAIAVMLILLCRRTRYRRAAWIGGISFALLTGFSRIYLGVHYPTDVWAGWTNGTLTALLVYMLIFRPSEK
ncbi:TPA: phosphatase PAP2 family protein [Neisseria subflava]|jgi:phosphoesterase, PA-phosphatase-related protein